MSDQNNELHPLLESQLGCELVLYAGPHWATHYVTLDEVWWTHCFNRVRHSLSPLYSQYCQSILNRWQHVSFKHATLAMYQLNIIFTGHLYTDSMRLRQAMRDFNCPIPTNFIGYTISMLINRYSVESIMRCSLGEAFLFQNCRQFRQSLPVIHEIFYDNCGKNFQCFCDWIQHMLFRMETHLLSEEILNWIKCLINDTQASSTSRHYLRF